MLAAALAASLNEQPQQQPPAAAAAAASGEPKGASDGPQHGDSSESMEHYYGKMGPSGPTPVAAAFGEEVPAAGVQQGGEEVPAERTSTQASQALADSHAGQEAAVVRQPSLELKQAMADAAAHMDGSIEGSTGAAVSQQDPHAP